MLVLSRKQGQSIEFTEMDVVVRVVTVKGSRVQLGIQAPAEITIRRSEKQLDSVKTEVSTSLAETRRIRDELSRLESELASLAELADAKDLSIARQLAADSIRRLEGIRRSLSVGIGGQRSKPRPIAELVRVRPDVLEQLRQEQPTQQASVSWSDDDCDRSNCVRQSPSSYAVVQSRLSQPRNVA